MYMSVYTFSENKLNGKRILTTDDFVSGPTGATGSSFQVSATGERVTLSFPTLVEEPQPIL